MTSTSIYKKIHDILNMAKKGDIPEAQRQLEALLKTNEADINILLLLAELHVQTGEHKHAIQKYKKVIQLMPNNIQAHTNLGMLLHQRGNITKAEQSYIHSLEIDSNQPVINFNLGSIYQQLGKLDEAKKQYIKAISQNPTYAKAYSNLGYIQRKLNMLDDSIASYRQAIKYLPDSEEIFYNLGLSLLQNGMLDDAEHTHKMALQLNAYYSDAHEGLGAVYLHKDELAKAEDSFKQAITCNNKNINAICGLAETLSRTGLHTEAKKQIEIALLTDPDNIDVISLHGRNLLALGDLTGALKICKTALNRLPTSKNLLSMAASIYEKMGQAGKAYTYLEPLLASPTNTNIETVLCYSSISKSVNRVDDAIRTLKDILDNRPLLQAGQRRHLHFALGKAYDSIYEYDKAFGHFKAGNHLKPVKFSITSYRKMIDATITTFNKNLLAKHSIENSSKPVFIIGMPRSGTSLVEQIIASHPDVYGAGELPDIYNITTDIEASSEGNQTYPKCLLEIAHDGVDKYTKSYMDHINSLSQNAKRITDKMPTNYLHIGLISMLFPNASIIHCMRNPFDTCLSCYFQDFGSNAHPWIYNLENLAYVYNEYIRLMHHWQQVCGIKMYDVKYEDLVQNQEIISKELLKHIGVQWDKRCMNFHKNKRFIWTASYEQVRQPMYIRSVARWKNYKKQLKPLIDIIGNNT